ncbi:hypothetical protein BsWGS_22334 [Bradybaena similaris]|jgi:hypothetical protein
MKLGG